ncbi:uncharacterized protein FFNC_15691 [Fusarium fujikuroi]|nr:uncharacterized protein FFNC_15691 [Fusarium fujikuroi]
MPELLLYNKTI